MKKKCFIIEYSVMLCKVLFLVFYENGNIVMYVIKWLEISFDFYISLFVINKKVLFFGDEVICMIKLLIFYLV